MRGNHAISLPVSHIPLNGPSREKAPIVPREAPLYAVENASTPCLTMRRLTDESKRRLAFLRTAKRLPI